MASKHFVITPSGAVTFFNTAGQARSAAAEGDAVASKQADLLAVSGPTLVAVYNDAAAKGEGKPVAKFADKEAAARRVWPCLDFLATAGTPVAGTPRTPRAKGTGNGRRGRTSAFAGKVIRKLVEGNPRRAGSHGFNSYALIREGMKVETFIENGGRLKDLAWDVAAKHVKVVAE